MSNYEIYEKTEKFGLYKASKTFHDFPCAHRIPSHTGACSKLHGYCRSFRIDFSAMDLNSEGFVIDLSALSKLEEFLRDRFDHTVLLRKDDPTLPFFEVLQDKNALSIRLFDEISSEHFAKYVFERVAISIQDNLSGKLTEKGFAEQVKERMDKKKVNLITLSSGREVYVDRVHVMENHKIQASYGV